MIYDMTPIKDADKLTKEKYEPCCRTPLFDAIGKTVKTLKDYGAVKFWYKEDEEIQEGEPLSTMVILMGLQGSGKSTFF